MSETVLDSFVDRLQGALEHNENAEEPPIALLWPDSDQQFSGVAEVLADKLPVVTLGALDADKRRGPSYWLRCIVAGTVKLEMPEGKPIVYMPGVGRGDLRAVESCPRELAPIAELQYRSQWFGHPNGKDWTIRSFLANKERGLGFDVADDNATHEALLGSLSTLLALPVRRLESQRIDATFLHQLLNPDPVAQILEWLDDPGGTQARLDPARWRAFVGQCKKTYDFDPTKDGEVAGGRLLGTREGPWDGVWKRFEQNPERYSGVEARLRNGKPATMFPEPVSSWPQENEAAEARLRTELSELAGKPPGEVRRVLQKLWGQNRERQGWVWARLDRAPLAFALEHLERLAENTSSAPAETVEQIAQLHTAHGWEADDAFLAALQATSDSGDREAVVAAGSAVYRPWLDTHARALQSAVGSLPNGKGYEAGGQASTETGTVTVFVDGLRLDLAHRLAQRLANFEVTMNTALAALPTVTETAKPALAPVPAGALKPGEGFATARATNGAKANINVLRSLMTERNVQVLQGTDTGDPSGTAWTDAADIDKRGHDFGAALVDEIDHELDAIARRVRLLLEAGWQRVDVLTDHGWILLPETMEKVELPIAAVEVRKGRCARLKEGATVKVPTVPWFWDGDVNVALAPGVTCFEANQAYEHGGVSPQECVVPRLSVRPGQARTTTGGAGITSLKWHSLMCRIEFENVAPGAQLDIRELPADESTSIADTVKEATSSGTARLFVRDEDFEGRPAFVVIVGSDGSILAQRNVFVGENR